MSGDVAHAGGRLLGVTPLRLLASIADGAVERWTRPGTRRATWWDARTWLGASPPGYLGLRLLGDRPVVRLGRFGTLVTDPVIGRAILTDTVRFRTVGPGTHGELLDMAIGPDALLNMDGERHEALRRSLVDLFGPVASRALVDRAARPVLDEAAQRLGRGESLDVVGLVRILTGRTAFELLGAAPPPDGDAGYLRMYRDGEALVGMTGRAIRRGVRDGELSRAQRLVDRLAEPARDAWDRGGTGTLARLREIGLTFEEARALIVVIILAGTETMSSGAPRVVALLHDGGAWPGLDATAPASIDAALEAALRLATPTQVIVRSCAEAVTYDGHAFRPGERVFVSVYSMARSRRLYPRNPGALRVGQPLPRELRHIWFGAGPHFCLGAGIARGQLHALVTMLAAVPDLHIVRRRVATGVLFPAYAELVVRSG